jgi:hypothetical protein
LYFIASCICFEDYQNEKTRDWRCGSSGEALAKKEQTPVLSQKKKKEKKKSQLSESAI